MEPWHHGTMGPWCHGTMGPWCHGTMVQWYHGPMVPWNHGTMVPWYPSILNDKSWMIDHESSIMNHQSSIINHRSPIIDHRSSVTNKQSSTINTQSLVITVPNHGPDVVRPNLAPESRSQPIRWGDRHHFSSRICSDGSRGLGVGPRCAPLETQGEGGSDNQEFQVFRQSQI